MSKLKIECEGSLRPVVQMGSLEPGEIFTGVGGQEDDVFMKVTVDHMVTCTPEWLTRNCVNLRTGERFTCNELEDVTPLKATLNVSF